MKALAGDHLRHQRAIRRGHDRANVAEGRRVGDAAAGAVLAVGFAQPALPEQVALHQIGSDSLLPQRLINDPVLAEEAVALGILVVVQCVGGTEGML